MLPSIMRTLSKVNFKVIAEGEYSTKYSNLIQVDRFYGKGTFLFKEKKENRRTAASISCHLLLLSSLQRL